MITPYLSFRGNAAAAFEFYRSVFGGEVVVMGYDQMPADVDSPPMPEGAVMHGQIVFGDNTLMGADVPPDVEFGHGGICVNYMLTDVAESERVFAALCEGGSVEMPITPTFFANRFGMCTDRFGTPWMVYCEFPAGAA